MATMQECITNCLDCHSVCLHTTSHCLSKGEDHAEFNHIRVCRIACRFALPALTSCYATHRCIQ